MEDLRNQTPTGGDRLAEYAEWKRLYESDERSPQDQYRQVSNIALCMAYDLIDKLRWWEKETLNLTDEQIAQRVPHLAAFLDQLKEAYLRFSDVDL